MKTLNHKYALIKGSIFPAIDNLVKAGYHGSTVIVPHICNNINIFGGGFTKELSTRFPIVKENYHLLGTSFLKKHPGYVQYIEAFKDSNYGYKIIFANMICQNGILSNDNPRPLNYGSLVKSMFDVSNYINAYKQKNPDHSIQIHAPKFGSGLAGGNWNMICSLIEDIWSNHKVFIYYI